MVDIHTHVLPCMDDGSKSVSQSLEMLRMIKQQGIDLVAATPHYDATVESPDTFLSRREQSFGALQGAMLSQGNMPALTLGAEVRYFDGMSGVDALERMRIGRSRLLLVEMPFRPWTERMLTEIGSLWVKMELMPLLAHIERYLSFLPMSVTRRLYKENFLIQANASYFLERETSRRAVHMLQAGKIHLLGSDCHNTRSRAPNLGDALKLIGTRAPKALDTVRHLEDELLEET